MIVNCYKGYALWLYVPFTPFHFAPSLWLGFGFYKKIYVPAILIGCIIIDIEPILVILFNLNYPLHGYLHTYLAALVMGVVTCLICIIFRSFITSIMNSFFLHQESNLSFIALGSFIGTFSHIFLDSFLYFEMHPFFPILGNPFFGVLSSDVIYGFCLVSFIPGLALLFYRIRQWKNSHTLNQ
jgi:membrane-bound metal-dependent hydrolase YbcI (DUF457 family)